MANAADAKLQLIIEAIYNTEAAFRKVKKDLAEIEAAGAAVNRTGNAGAGAFQGMGPAVAAARDHVAAAQKDLPALAEKFAALRAQFAAIGTTSGAAGKAMEEAGTHGAHGMDQVHDHAHRAHSMLGQMVQMAILFGSLALAGKIAESGIEYNKALEVSQLGISAIMTSMGVITDQQGRALQGQEKWNSAQRLSVEAQRELEKIAMDTPATYEELVQAYQGLEAPSLAAKINFADSLELAGLLTNSVKAMGLPMNQIVQEGRDLVAGTIDQNSQLAKSLGITNDDVKKWKEKGTLFQEIKQRLEGFAYASQLFGSTWDGAWSNFKDIAQHALGEGSKPLFDYIKKEVQQISGDMVNITRDASGKVIDVQVKPEVIARIRTLAEELEKLIRFLEGAVKWGSKLAEPMLLGGIALGITKITKAVKDLAVAAESGALARLITSLPALAAVAGLWMGKQYADANSLKGDAADIRLRARVDKDHESSRLKAMGVNTLQHLDDFGWQQLSAVRQKLPTADNSQIAGMLRRGIISMQKETVPGFDKEWRIVVKVDDKAARQYLEGPKPTDTITGPNKKTAEQIKKENNEARAAIEDTYAAELEAIRKTESQKVESYKTTLKEKELLFQKGAISEEQYVKAQAETQKGTLQASLDGIKAQQAKLTEEWNAKSGTYNDAAERSKGHKEYVAQWNKLEEEKSKKTAELTRAATDEEIKQIERRRQVETAQREGALRLLQEQLSAEKQMTQLLLEREKITPLEAEKRNISTEQSGMEADYWNAFAKLNAGGLTQAQIIDLKSQLQVLEQRMEDLSSAAPSRLYKAGRETDTLIAKREEAQISHELADLDEQERMREVGKTEALRQRKDLLEELLESQQAVLDGIDPSDTTAWNTQQAAIDGTRQKILEVKLAMRDLSDDMAGGFMEGLHQYLDENEGVFKQMVDLSRSTASAMQASFSDLFFDAMQGKLKSFGDYVGAFLASVERAIANAMAQKLVTSMIGGGLGSMLGFRAEGGSVTAGQPYIVGEKGMELFIPQASGTIIPNHALSKSAPSAVGGGSSSISVSLGGITVEAGGGSNDADLTRAAGLGRLIQTAITQALIKEKRPGGLLY